MQETWVRSLGWEDPLEKGKATHSSILAWRILWTTVHGVTNSQTWLSDFHFHFTRKFRFWSSGLEFSEGNKEQLSFWGVQWVSCSAKLLTPLLFYPCPGTRTFLAAMVVCICSPSSGISCTQASLKPGRQEALCISLSALSIAPSIYVSDSLQPHGL